jgi:hypothetical protein
MVSLYIEDVKFLRAEGAQWEPHSAQFVLKSAPINGAASSALTIDLEAKQH